MDAIAVNGEVVTIHNGSATDAKSYWDGMLIRCCSGKAHRGLEKGQKLKSLETAMLVLQYRWRNGRKNDPNEIFMIQKIESKMFHKELLKLYFILWND